MRRSAIIFFIIFFLLLAGPRLAAAAVCERPEALRVKEIQLADLPTAQDVAAKLKAGGNFDDLAKQYSKVFLVHNRDGGVAQLAQGGEAGWIFRSDFAPEDANRIFALTPGNVSDPVKVERGYAILQIEERSAAVSCQQSIKSDPNDVVARLRLARQYAIDGKFPAALTEYNRALAIDGRSGPAYYGRAVVYMNNGNFKQALSDVNAAIDNSFANEDSYALRATIEVALGDNELATADAAAALKWNPNDARARLARGSANAGLGFNRAAIEDFNFAFAHGMASPQGYNARGGARFATGDLAGARKDFATAITGAPKFEVALLNLGVADYYLGNYPQAHKDFAHATLVAPSNGYGWLWLAIASTRSHEPPPTTPNLASLKPMGWPAPLVGLFAGERSVDQVAAAQGRTAVPASNVTCEEDYYVGMYLQWRGDKSGAAQGFKRAADECPMTEIERFAAERELR